jgi:hypothetical protein
MIRFGNQRLVFKNKETKNASFGCSNNSNNHEEFDPGSDLMLVACLKHASRTNVRKDLFVANG